MGHGTKVQVDLVEEKIIGWINKPVSRATAASRSLGGSRLRYQLQQIFDVEDDQGLIMWRLWVLAAASLKVTG